VDHGHTAGIELDLVLARRRKAEVAVLVQHVAGSGWASVVEHEKSRRGMRC
jgi:hypothetical protein